VPASPPIIVRTYEAWNRRDRELLRSCLHDDVRFHIPASVPFARELHGPDAVCEYAEEIWAFWGDTIVQLDRVSVNGARIVVHGRHANAERAGVPFVHAAELRDGLVVELREQLDAGLVMRAVMRRLQRGDRAALVSR